MNDRPSTLKAIDGQCYELHPTNHGKRLLEEWVAASIETDRSRATFERHTANEKEAETKLGSWMLPPDAQVGEKICMWNGPNLIQAEKTADGARVTIRSRHSR